MSTVGKLALVTALACLASYSARVVGALTRDHGLHVAGGKMFMILLPVLAVLLIALLVQRLRRA